MRGDKVESDLSLLSFTLEQVFNADDTSRRGGLDVTKSMNVVPLRAADQVGRCSPWFGHGPRSCPQRSKQECFTLIGSLGHMSSG